MSEAAAIRRALSVARIWENEAIRKGTRSTAASRRRLSTIITGLEAAEAKIAGAAALAARWTAIPGHDQRAATHHALADDLREVLDPKESQR